MNPWKSFVLSLAICSLAAAQATRPATRPTATQPAWHLNPNLPTIFLAGDSTAQVGDPLHTGWGKPFAAYVDPTKANWVNAARGGRSSRTFITEGWWDRIVANLKPGDFVFIQFGHNDGGFVNDARAARGSLPGLGDETQEIDNLQTKQHETVHTYGYYMRKMVEETKSRGATPIMLSLTVRNIWTDGHVERGSGHFDLWARQIAVAEHVAFIDLTDMVANRYEQLGQQAVAAFFPADHTHTAPAGAAINAQYVLAGVKALNLPILQGLLSPAAQPIAPATQPSVIQGQAGQ